MVRKIVDFKNMPNWKELLSYGDNFEYDGYAYKIIEEHNCSQSGFLVDRNRVFRRSDNAFFSYDFQQSTIENQPDRCEPILHEVFRTPKMVYVYK